MNDSTFRALLEAAPDGILVVGRDGTIVLVNARCAEMFGFTKDELEGQLIEVLVPPYIRSKHATLRDGYVANPHTRPMGIGMDLTATRKDGQLVPVEVSLSPFELAGERCTIAIVRDVTELRRLDRELKRNNLDLKRSNEELERFAYVASHDLQEPLRMISGYTQLLERRFAHKLDKDGIEYIHVAVDGAKRMQNLINDLLTYSRISSRVRAFTAVDCGDVVRQVVATLKPRIEGLHATIDIAPLPHVHGDRSQLVQLFQNLMGNALKFHRQGVAPVIRIDAERDEDHWRFAIKDNGIGIEPQYAESIFVVFQRLHSREKYEGTGIGLAICKKVVERHEGRIWLESKPSEGTSFFFTLPCVETKLEADGSN